MALDFNALIQKLVAAQAAQQGAVGQLQASLANKRNQFTDFRTQLQDPLRDRRVPLVIPSLGMNKFGSAAPTKKPSLFAPNGAITAGPPKMIKDEFGNLKRAPNPTWAGF